MAERKAVTQCQTCSGEGFTYPLVQEECLLCKLTKNLNCNECGGTGFTRQMRPQRCESCPLSELRSQQGQGLDLLPTKVAKEGATSK